MLGGLGAGMLRGIMGGWSIAAVCRVLLLGLVLAGAEGALGQEVIEREGDLSDRPISAIHLAGLSDVDEQVIWNNIRSAVGDPYDTETVRGDVNRLYSLGRFKYVTVEVEMAGDGSVVLIYSLREQPQIQAVQTVGNRSVSDQDLRAIVQQMPGLARDDYLIEKAKRDIEGIYRKKGFYLTSVSVDESELEERGLLIFRVIEGPRVRVRAIEFEGAETFPSKQLMRQIRTRTHIFLLRPGVLDEERLTDDVAALDEFYRDRGFLDVRVGRTIELSPENTEAKVTFLIDEGERYVVRTIRVEHREDPAKPLEVFSPAQIAAILEIKTGDVYSADKIRKSLRAVRDAYGVMGYLDEEEPNQWGGVRVEVDQLRTGPEPEVDLVVQVDEGRSYKVGLVRIQGNFLTKEKVVRRLVRLKPGRPFDSAQLEETQRRIEQTQLFNEVRITIQEPDEEQEDHRDVLIEVKERNTGSLNFGVAMGSDSGVFGEISLVQRNFDILDYPESFSEFISGRAFRGAGQRFTMTFRPGDELFQYSASLTEPHLFETDYSLSALGSYQQRDYREYDEERITGAVSLSRKFGDIWEVGARARAQRVELDDILWFAPVDVFEAAGPDTLTSLGLTVSRTTVGTLIRPGKGSRLELSLDRFGTMGGDYDFYRAEGEYTVFLTLDEDFLGRKSILKLSGRVGYLFGDDRAPVYERFYLGGRSFRGFEFREVSPKGIRADTGELGDDPVGGEWLVFVGGQYEFPLFEEVVTGVAFMDTGTVTKEVGLDAYRVSVGLGLRLYIRQLGPVPIAFDFGFPLVKEESDETRVLSFSAELPF